MLGLINMIIQMQHKLLGFNFGNSCYGVNVHIH